VLICICCSWQYAYSICFEICSNLYSLELPSIELQSENCIAEFPIRNWVMWFELLLLCFENVTFLSIHFVCFVYVKAEKPPLSPLPVRRSHATSPRKVSNNHSVYVSPHKPTTASGITPQSRLLYCFNRSPARVCHFVIPHSELKECGL